MGGRAGYELYACSYTEMQAEMGAAIRTSLGAPRWKLKYQIRANLAELTPTRSMLALAKAGEKDKYERAYREQLDEIGWDRIHERFKQLEDELGEPRLVLLCFDKLGNGPDEWCHRTMFAQWVKEQCGLRVRELGKVWKPGDPIKAKPKKRKKKPKGGAQPTLF